MKKNYTFLLMGIIVPSLSLFSQGYKSNISSMPSVKMKLNSNVVQRKAENKSHKAIGDTLYYEDFGSGGPNGSNLPLGWTVINNAGNSNNWIWSTSAPGGQYSGTVPALNSTSASNGFMSLPGDLYNTPTPSGGFIGMDVSVVSPMITIPATPSVILKVEQLHRYCCVTSGDLVIEVSSDGINYDIYDATGGVGPNSITANPEIFEVNVSNTLTNQTTAYIRFRQSQSSHYFWMFDDLLLKEGAANNMQLEDFAINFNDTFDYNPVYTMIPQAIMMPMNFDMASVNAGSNTQTGVYFEAQVDQDSTITGGPGFGITWSDTAQVVDSVLFLERDTTNISGYVNTFAGYFRGVVKVESDSVNQEPGSARGEYAFSVTDSVFARDRGVFTGITGPGNFVGGGNDGDRWAVLFSVGQSGAMIKSLTAYIGNTALNDGVQIVPKVWSFVQDSATLNGALSTVVAENFVPTTIDTTMFGTWVTFDFTPGFGTGPKMLQGGKQYAFGFEQIGGAQNGLEMFFGRDVGMEPFAPAVTNFVYVNNATPGWGWITRVAGIRGNFNTTVGIDEEAKNEVAFEVAPNPNIGQFNVIINNDVAANYTLNVRNMLGQVVYTNQISVNKKSTQQLDLSSYEKGVYFVSLENGDNRLVKKVVVR